MERKGAPLAFRLQCEICKICDKRVRKSRARKLSEKQLKLLKRKVICSQLGNSKIVRKSNVFLLQLLQMYVIIIAKRET